MLNKFSLFISFALFLILGNFANAQQASGLSTLFTTAQERQLINTNRYKVKPAEKINTQQITSKVVEKIEKAEREKVTLKLSLSGFTLTQSGQNVAWINGKPHENGSKLEDGSRLVISSKNKVSVQLKTPDGKFHKLSTGKPLEVKYIKPQEKG